MKPVISCFIFVMMVTVGTCIDAAELSDKAKKILEKKEAKAAAKEAARFVYDKIAVGPLGIQIAIDPKSPGLIVNMVEEKGPSAKTLEVRDRILACNGVVLPKAVMVKVKARISKTPVPLLRQPSLLMLADAIESAEALEPPVLKLRIERDGKEKEVELALTHRLKLAKTWPYNCETSREVYDAACAHLAATQGANGTWHKLKGGGLMTNATAGLALLGHPDQARYKPHVDKLTKAFLAEDGIVRDGYVQLPYLAMYLSEHELKYPNPKVKALLEEIYAYYLDGAQPYGGWGHSYFSGTYGLGAFAISTTHVMASLGLMRHVVELDEKRTRHTIDHLNLISNHGALSYHGSFLDRNPSEERINVGGEAVARTGTAALGLHLLGQDPNNDLPQMTGYLAEPKTYIHFSRPHVTHVMGRLWCSIALGHLSPEGFRAYMDAEKWYFLLGRRYDGRLTLGPTEGSLGRGMTAEPDAKMFKSAFPCAAQALVYGMGTAKLKMFEGLKPVESYSTAYAEWNRYLATHEGEMPKLMQEQFPAEPARELSAVKPYDYRPSQALRFEGSQPVVLNGEITRISKSQFTMLANGANYHVAFARGTACKIFKGEEQLTAPTVEGLAGLSAKKLKQAMKTNPDLKKAQSQADKRAKERITELLQVGASLKVTILPRGDEKSGKKNDGSFRTIASKIEIL